MDESTPKASGSPVRLIENDVVSINNQNQSFSKAAKFDDAAFAFDVISGAGSIFNQAIGLDVEPPRAGNKKLPPAKKMDY